MQINLSILEQHQLARWMDAYTVRNYVEGLPIAACKRFAFVRWMVEQGILSEEG